MGKFGTYIKSNWEDAWKWLLGALLGLIIGKAGNRIWPDPPTVVKEVSDTVKFVHSFSPLPQEADSLLYEQIERQMLALELLNKYEAAVHNQKQEPQLQYPCKMVLGNPYPHSKGYVQKSSSAICSITWEHNTPFIDITFSFLRSDYVNSVNTLGIKVARKTDDGKRVLVFDYNYEPQRTSVSLVRIVDDFAPGEYTIEAGFLMKDDINAQYPSFYSLNIPFHK